MIKIKKTSCILITVLYLLISCVGERNASESSNKITNIYLENFLQKEDLETLSSIASEIIYIPLETNDNSLLRDIWRIVYLENNFLISDMRNIYLFNNEGKFIKRISQKGEGPSDFTTGISNIIIDPSTNDFYLFSVDKVIKFDKDANYIRYFLIENIEEGVYQLYQNGLFTNRSTFMLGVQNRVKLYGDTSTIYNAIEIDSLGNIINKFINYSPRYAQSWLRQMSNNAIIYEFNSDIKFMDFGNDTIFSVIDDHMIPYVVFNLGEKKSNLIIDNSNERKFSDGYYIRKIIEDESFLFFELRDANSIIFFNCFYNKITKELKLLKNNGLLNDLDGGITFFPQKSFDNNEFIDWKSAEEFKEEILKKNYNEYRAKYGEQFEKVYQLAKSLMDDDNPILIITKN